MSSAAITRRQALVSAAAAAAGLYGIGCGGGAQAGSGSTLVSTWADPTGSGTLARAGGEALIHRTELAPASSTGRTLLTIAHVTDAHVLDASSPARVTFLDRFGAPFGSTFRPHETLTVQTLAGITRAVRALAPDLVIQGGDLIDNAQANELAQALRTLAGGRLRPGSGPRGYYGVQLAANADPFYYRPDLDAPRHPGLLSRAVARFSSPGVGPARVLPVLGDHDILVAGEIPPSPRTQALATGGRALWEPPPHLTVPGGSQLTVGGSPDGPPNPQALDQLLTEALTGPRTQVPADPERRELGVPEALARLGASAGATTLDYAVPVAGTVLVVVLDLARRGGGSGGLVRAEQPAWLAGVLARAGSRHVIVFSHQPLEEAEGGDALLSQLDAHPHTIALVCGHTHRNRIRPRRAAAGGYWSISTASLIDFPQQARVLRLRQRAGGGVAIETWMLDHVLPGGLGEISRGLAYLDAQGGRPAAFAGSRADRNAVLHLPAGR